jgi:hypothetical protein
MGKGNKVQDTQLRLSRQTQEKNKKTFKYSLLTLSLSLSLSLRVCVYVDFPRRCGANCHLDQPGMDIYPAI